MTASLPEPLVPPDVDLRDFGYMPLDALRLRDSDLAIEASPEVFRASVLLWCASWHQVPAGSLPNKDKILTDYSRSGARWPRIRAEVLSRWIECSDGRLYHPVVAEKAREAQAAKDAQRARTRAATEAREAKRRAAAESSVDVHENARDVERDVVRDEQREAQRDVERNVVQGKGREGKGIEEIPPKPPRGGSVHRFPPGFETLWAEYPRKIGKDAAARAFAKRRPDETLLSAMVSAVRTQRQSEQWTRDGGQFIPHLATWLNGGRWQDEAQSPAARGDDVFAGAM